VFVSEIDYCVNNTCTNGGQCVRYTGGYSCKCANDTFYGTFCQWRTYHFVLINVASDFKHIVGKLIRTALFSGSTLPNKHVCEILCTIRNFFLFRAIVCVTSARFLLKYH